MTSQFIDETVSISQIIRSVLREIGDSDTDTITAEVLSRITDPWRALDELVRARLSSEMSRQRGSALSASSERVVPQTPTGRPLSAKVAAARAWKESDWWQEYLSSWIIGVEGRVRLADATSADLRHYAATATVQAALAFVNAERSERYAARMDAEGVRTLSEMTRPTEEEAR